MAEFANAFHPAGVAAGISTVDVDEIYGSAIYRPTTTISDSAGVNPHTFEALNGGLTSKNIETVTAEAFRAGTFARGFYYGFNFQDSHHSAQHSPDDVSMRPSTTLTSKKEKPPANKVFIPHPSLCASFWCPWESVGLISLQGFFGGRLTKFSYDPVTVPPGAFDKTHKKDGESWRFRLFVNDEIQYGSRFYLRSTRVEDRKKVEKGATQKFSNSPGSEYRFRWHQRTRLVNLRRGYNTIALSIWPLVLHNAAGTKHYNMPRIQTYCGGISVLAMKQGSIRAHTGLSPQPLEYYSRQADVPPEATSG